MVIWLSMIRTSIATGAECTNKKALNQTHDDVGSIDSPFYRYPDQPLAGFNNGRALRDGGSYSLTNNIREKGQAIQPQSTGRSLVSPQSGHFACNSICPYFKVT